MISLIQLKTSEVEGIIPISQAGNKLREAKWLA